MKAKSKLGMGITKKNICKKNLFSSAVKNATSVLKKKKPHDINAAINIAQKEIGKSFKGKKSNVIIPRVIRIPKIGGFLPIIPILTALSAVGALATGGSSIMKAINSTKDAKRQLEENIRHNKSMENIAIGKGLYLKPFKKGMGIIYKNKLSTKN